MSSAVLGPTMRSLAHGFLERVEDNPCGLRGKDLADALSEERCGRNIELLRIGCGARAKAAVRIDLEHEVREGDEHGGKICVALLKGRLD
jgi:hypothetical protein